MTEIEARAIVQEAATACKLTFTQMLKAGTDFIVEGERSYDADEFVVQYRYDDWASFYAAVRVLIGETPAYYAEGDNPIETPFHCCT